MRILQSAVVAALLVSSAWSADPLQKHFPSGADLKAKVRDDARIIKAKFSANPIVGQVADLKVMVKNTGTTTWTWTDPSNFYALGFGPDGKDENYKGRATSIRVNHPGGAMPDDFDGNRITLTEGEKIKPGAVKEWGCRVEYEAAGVHYVSLQMVKENGVALGQRSRPPDGWFGERLRVEVHIDQ